MVRPYFLAGRFAATSDVSTVRSPYTNAPVAEVALADDAAIEQALSRAAACRQALARTSTGARRTWLVAIADGIAARKDEIARSIALEAGKPISSARGEVNRAVETFTLAAAETTGRRDERVPIDLDARSEGHDCVVRRVPAGVVVAISPFNFPLNLAAHKVAPALAVGAPCILKPPPQAPSAGLMLAEIAAEAGVLAGALSVLPCDNALAERMATDPRVAVVSFTGSAQVGWHLKQKVGRARVLLELGGNAAAVVCADADLDRAAQALAASAFAYAGQVCISTQRILIHESVADAFIARFLDATRAMVLGDPLDERTALGPVIDDRAADRISAKLAEARARGARVLLGGARDGRLIPAHVLENVPRDVALYRDEVFGPAALLERFTDFDAALDAVNDSDWGLQAALFTRDLYRVQRASDVLEVGGLIINDSPSFRSDAYPYGGVKGSGLGREGLRSTMVELTEPRAIVTARG